MPDRQPRPVRLHEDGLSFTCPYCKLTSRYPFCDPFDIAEGRACCYYCRRMVPIEKGPEPPEDKRRRMGRRARARGKA